MNQDTKRLLAQAGIPACAAALAISLAILDWVPPRYSQYDLDSAEKALYRAQQNHSNAYVNAEESSYAHVDVNPTYQELIRKLDSIVEKMPHAYENNKPEYKRMLGEYDKLCERCAIIEDSIRCQYLKNDKTLKMAEHDLIQAKRRHATIKEYRDARMLKKQKNK